MTVPKRERERKLASSLDGAGELGDLPWGDRTTHSGPLAGLRVIDAGTMIAGPFTSTLLADYGADVIKIEKPGAGDSMRQWTPMKAGRSLWWKVNARNKRLMTLDLSQPMGQAVFLRMARHADVIVENFRPGTFERWGLGYDVLSDINPGVILVRVSGYGQTGPYRRRPGYGTVADAISGIPAFTGFADGPPTLPAFPLADSLAGCFGVIGALCALRDRERSGVGDEIDVSLYEPLMRITESQVIAYDQLGLKKRRVGNRLEEDSPRNTYPTSDDHWIALSASSDRTFGRLAQAIGQPGLARDERFATNPARIAHADQLDAIVGEWIAARPAAAVMASFEAHDVVAGRVYDIEDIFADPHFAARRDIVEVPDDDFGRVRMQCVVPRFARHGCELRHAGRAVGDDNDFVLRRVLRLEDREVEQLESEGVV